MARTRSHAFGRCHQPPGDRREPRGGLPHGDAALYPIDHCPVHRSIRIPAADGRVAGHYHREHLAAFHRWQPLLCGQDATTEPKGARKRQLRTKHADRDHATPHAHQDHGGRRADAGTAGRHTDGTAAEGEETHTVLGALEPFSKHRILLRLPHCLPLGTVAIE